MESLGVKTRNRDMVTARSLRGSWLPSTGYEQCAPQRNDPQRSFRAASPRHDRWFIGRSDPDGEPEPNSHTNPFGCANRHANRFSGSLILSLAPG